MAEPVQELEIPLTRGSHVHADLRTCAEFADAPLIIVCHGFLGYKRWGFFPYLSERLAKAGFHVLTMSFSLNGVDEKTGRFRRPDDFAANTVSAEIADLRGVCAFVRSGALASSGAKIRRWGLFGHSRGGAIAILVAPEFEEVRAIVTWSTVARLDRYTARRKVQWKKDGALVFTDGRSPVPLRLGYGYFQDIEAHGRHFDLPRAAGALTIPHLMVHGDHDGAVTPSEARLLAAAPRSGPARLEIIRGAGHTFNVRHPMHRPTPALERSVRLTTEWFTDTLGEPGKERP